MLARLLETIELIAFIPKTLKDVLIDRLIHGWGATQNPKTISARMTDDRVIVFLPEIDDPIITPEGPKKSLLVAWHSMRDQPPEHAHEQSLPAHVTYPSGIVSLNVQANHVFKCLSAHNHASFTVSCEDHGWPRHPVVSASHSVAVGAGDWCRQ